MSRTYHHGNKAKQRKFGGWNRYLDPTPPKRPRHHIDWQWMNTPSWWTRLMMTRPQRQEARRLITQLYRLPDIADAPPFPLAKKPHIYYW